MQEIADGGRPPRRDGEGGGTARAGHGVHARGPLPAAALPRADRGRRARRGARPADGRPSTRRRWPRSSPTRRSRSCSTPAARMLRSCDASGRRRSRTSSTRRSRPASRASRPRRATTACSTTSCGSGCPKTASFTRWDARPLTEEQISYARGDVEHLMPLADDIQAPADGPRPARVGARGVRRDRRGHRRARPDRGLAPAAARERAGPARARRRAGDHGLARAHRRRRGPPGRRRPARPDRGRAGQAPALRPPRPGADPRHHAGRGAPPRRRRDRGDRGRPQRGADQARGGRPLARPRPSTARRSRSPSRWCARARRRPGWPTS